jgi:hypothetical protein
MNREEELGIGKNRRKVDMKEEYYVIILLEDFVYHDTDENVCRDWRRKIWTTGSKPVSKDYREKAMGFYNANLEAPSRISDERTPRVAILVLLIGWKPPFDCHDSQRPIYAPHKPIHCVRLVGMHCATGDLKNEGCPAYT